MRPTFQDGDWTAEPHWIARRDRLLSDTAARLLQSEDPRAIVEELCLRVMEFLDCDVFFNYLLDRSSGKLHLNAYAGVSPDQAREIEWMAPGESLCRCATREGRRMVETDVDRSDDPATTAMKALGVRAYACHSLLSHDRLLGTLAFGARSRPRFRLDEVELMETVSNLVAIAMFRIAAEQDLRESEARYRDVVRKAPTGIYEIDFRTGKFTSVNDAMVILTGYSREELLAMNATDLMDEAGRAGFRARVERWLRGDPPDRNVEYRIRAKDGREIVAAIDATFRFDEEGRPDGVTAVAHDVTERRRVEERALRQAKVLDGINRIFREAMTAKTEEHLGRVCLAAADEVTGSRFGFIGEMNPEGLMDEIAIDDPGWAACSIPNPSGTHRRLLKGLAAKGLFSRVLREGTSFFTNDPDGDPGRAGTPEGHPRLTSFLGVPLTRDGRLFGMVAVGNREGGYAREQAEDLEALAPAIVEAITHKRAEEALREADRRKDEFLAMLGHELRNPLAAITTAMDLMQLPDAGEAVRERARTVAARQAGHMRRLVDDLLDVSRITQGIVTLRRETVALADVVRVAVEGARPSIEALGHDLSIALPDAPLRVDGDAVRLAQIVGNLMNNAAKYTPPGGAIRLSLERNDGEAAIRVRDNGVGIAPELLPHVFDLFVQGERGPDRMQGGLGIGLTMVKRLAEMHGGRVAAESEGPGRGSEFTVWLPLAEAAGADAHPAKEKAAAAPKRILVVDDNADQAQLMALLLERLGHRAAMATSGPEALEKARAEKPDVVLIDLGMPGMDGYELARRMRASEELKGVHLIAHTGYGGDEDRERTREAGFDAHLVKPADLDTLRKMLA